MTHAPIVVEDRGVEERSKRVVTDSNPQPPISSAVSADHQFRTDLVLAFVALVGIAVHLVLRYVFHTFGFAQVLPLYFVLLVGGVPLVFRLIQKALAREFGSDLLAGISIVVSTLMGQYLVGAIVILMLSGGTALEEFAMRRASSVLEALAKRMPQTAHRKTASGISDIDVAQIAIGDDLIVFPHEICPVDWRGRGRPGKDERSLFNRGAI